MNTDTPQTHEEHPHETPETELQKAPQVFTPPPTPLQRASDMAVRPGFRNPANAKSKAQKKR
jgi:hypothetical protein